VNDEKSKQELVPPKEWYCKYLERITHRKIMDFIGMTKNLGNYEVSPKIFDSPDKDKTVLDICEDLARILNLPLCTIFHQIIQPECKECMHMVIRERDNRNAFSMYSDYQIFCMLDEKCPYSVIAKNVLFLPVERYAPPLGCDCWRPK